MSGKLMGQIYGLKLTPAKREILLAMAENADDDGGNCKPGVPYIAWKVDLSERQVQRIQKSLIQDKLLVVVDTPVRKPVVYRIDIRAGTQKPAYVPRGKGDKLSKEARVEGDILSSPVELRVTSHGKNENGKGDMGTGKMTSTHIQEEPLKAKEKEKELLSVLDVPGNPDEKISPEQQREAAAIFSALVAKVSPPQKQPFTDDEIQAQVAIALARQKARQIAAEAQT